MYSLYCAVFKIIIIITIREKEDKGKDTADKFCRALMLVGVVSYYVKRARNDSRTTLIFDFEVV